MVHRRHREGTNRERSPLLVEYVYPAGKLAITATALIAWLSMLLLVVVAGASRKGRRLSRHTARSLSRLWSRCDDACRHMDDVVHQQWPTPASLEHYGRSTLVGR